MKLQIAIFFNFLNLHFCSSCCWWCWWWHGLFKPTAINACGYRKNEHFPYKLQGFLPLFLSCFHVKPAEPYNGIVKPPDTMLSLYGQFLYSNGFQSPPYVMPSLLIFALSLPIWICTRCNTCDYALRFTAKAMSSQHWWHMNTNEGKDVKKKQYFVIICLDMCCFTWFWKL